MASYIDDMTLAQNRMAIGALRKNPANFRVFSIYISFGFIFGISVLAGSLVAIYNEDQQMDPNTVKILVFLNIATAVILFLSYTTYLRNVGKYVYGRIKPIGDASAAECKRDVTNFNNTAKQRIGSVAGIVPSQSNGVSVGIPGFPFGR